MGIVHVPPKSTLSHANKHGNWEIFCRCIPVFSEAFPSKAEVAWITDGKAHDLEFAREQKFDKGTIIKPLKSKISVD